MRRVTKMSSRPFDSYTFCRALIRIRENWSKMSDTAYTLDEELDEELQEISRILFQTREYAIDPCFVAALRKHLLDLFTQGMENKRKST
jgi:hypothetical protein